MRLRRAVGLVLLAWAPVSVAQYNKVGDGFCATEEGGMFNRCQFSAAFGATQPASQANCEAACDAATGCVAYAIRPNSVCALFIVGFPGTLGAPYGCVGGAAGASVVSRGARDGRGRVVTMVALVGMLTHGLPIRCLLNPLS